MIANTRFQEKRRKILTFSSIKNDNKSHIEHIHINRKLKNTVKDYKAFSGFASVWSDNSVLTLAAPCISESFIKIKINLNFYFHTSLYSKGFMNTSKAFIKRLDVPKRIEKIKIYVNFPSSPRIGRELWNAKLRLSFQTKRAA